MSLYSVFNVARDAINANSAGIDIAGQNISNINTPGYVRRSAKFETRGKDALEGGVSYGGIKRSFDRFAHARVITETSKKSAADSRSTELASVENTFAPGSGNSIGDRISSLLSAFSNLTVNASDTNARQNVLARATELAYSVNETAAKLSVSRQEMYQAAKDTVSSINEKLKRVADLNSQIAAAQVANDPAADLRDQRDQLVQELSEKIDVKFTEDNRGRYTVYGCGTTLVDGTKASTMKLSVDTSNNLKIEVVRGKTGAMDVTKRITSGELGGLRETRDVDIPNISSQLDQLAYDFSTAVNNLHTSGYGLDGTTGRPLFTQPSSVNGAALTMSVDSSVLNNPNSIAAAKQSSDLPGGNDLAMEIAQLAYQSLGSGGTPTERYGAIAGNVGIRKTSADNELNLRTSTVAQATNLRESKSGVSMAEEMVSLTKYQQAYEASMQILKTADSLLSSLMENL